MKFYDTGNIHDSLGHYVLRLLGAISLTQYPLVDIARATNTAKYQLAIKHFKRQDDWNFDDSGNTSDFPISTTDLVDSQQDYQLPNDCLEINRVEVEDINGNWSRLDKIDDTQITGAEDEFEDTDGVPRYYRVLNGSVFLYPSPDLTQTSETNALKLSYNRGVDEFTGSTTTTEVGFREPGDRIVAFEVAEEYALTFAPERLAGLQQRRVELENEYFAHISNRSKDKSNKFKVKFSNNE
jgi:hypothetical protein